MGSVGYPTQGEVLRFLYNAAGVLPEKRDHAPLDETKRKAIQKSLQRLAAEEGELEENFGEMYKQLAYLVAGYVELAPANLAVGEVVSDLLDVYQRAIRDEGTFLSTPATLRWLIRDRWVPAAAVSVARNITLFGLRPLAPYLPRASRWFLPVWADGGPIWPLQKVMRWVYTRSGLSQTQFHYPGRDADESNFERRRALENAQNWLQARSLPSAAALRWTFDQAFDEWPSSEPGTSDLLGQPARMHQEGVRVALFLARSANFVCQEIAAQFGEDFLKQVCDLFERDLTLALRETAGVEGLIGDLAEQHRASPLDPALRSHAVELWNDSLGSRVQHAGVELDRLYQANALTGEALEELVKTCGELPVVPVADMLRRPRGNEIPSGFEAALLEGLRLSKDQKLSSEQIDRYEADLQAKGVAPILPWMVPWLRFLTSYRNEDDARAWAWISQAYEEARYRAGSNQYKVVNHYVELAAKVQDRVAFRRGVNWARYVGVQVRWLRDRDPTPENLEFAMEALRRCRYGV